MTLRQGTFASLRAFIFHPLVVLLVSVLAAVLYALYASLRFSSGDLWGHYYYVAPIVVPFVAFLMARAENFARLKAIALIVDGLVVGVAVFRGLGHVPYISGHTLFLIYALFSTRTRVVQVTAAVVLLQVMYLKYVVWHDWLTPTSGLALGALAALVNRRLKVETEAELTKQEPTI